MDVFFETSRGEKFEIEIWFFSTVREIKENIQKYHGFPIPDQRLFFNGQELADDRNTEFYDILQGSHLHLELHSLPEEEPALPRPVAPPSITAQPQAVVPVPPITTRPQAVVPVAAQSKGPMKILVHPHYYAARKFPVEVSAKEKVRKLRKELQRLQREDINFKLPRDGKYFFLHKQNVMEDDWTFRWHGVKQGDTIDIFSGYIRNGGTENFAFL